MKRTAAMSAILLLLPAACSGTDTSVERATRTEQARSGEAVQQAEEAGGRSPAEKTARAAGANGDDAPYFTELPLSEFMPHVMQYAGDGVWKRQGYITDRNGTRSLFPKNDEEWEEAESGARTLAEITNVLLIPGRRVPDAAWDKAALAVRRVALQAADAAEKHDADAWFAAGGALDEACDECHTRFDPKFKPGQGG